MAVSNWCGIHVDIATRVVDRETIIKECRAYGVHLSRATADGEFKEAQLTTVL